MQTLDWLIFAILSLGILAGANIAQIGSIRHLGAAMVSSTMAWRLVSTLFLAALLLGERLASPLQLLGVVSGSGDDYLVFMGSAGAGAASRSWRIVL